MSSADRSMRTAALLAGASLAVASAVAAPPAQAIVVTQIAFSDTRQGFTWDFRWDGVIGSVATSATRGAGDALAGKQWDSTRTGGGTFEAPTVIFHDSATPPDLVEFRARHAVRCHDPGAPAGQCTPDGSDDPMGDQFTSFGIDVAMLVPTPNGGVDFATLASGVERHAHTPEPDHSDRFTVRYRRAAAGGEVVFAFTGEHLSTAKPAPEPSALGLLAAGVLGLAAYARRRARKSAPWIRTVGGARRISAAAGSA